jgi:nucleolar MIF4G domain-containing protein 1
MEKQFLSRKLKRKIQRQQKNEKKDLYYKNKNNKNNIKDKHTNTKNKIKNDINVKDFNKKNIKYNKHDDLEEIDSDIQSAENSNNSDDENKQSIEFNDNSNNNEIDNDADEAINNTTYKNDDIEKQIKSLEKKLHLKDSGKLDKFKKRLVTENWDEDLFEFLENIDTTVRNEKNASNVKNSNSKSTKLNNQNISKLNTTSTVNNNRSSPLPLEEIKSKSMLFKKIPKELQTNANVNVNKHDNSEEIKFLFQKDITSILNKISEPNLGLLFPEINQKIENLKIKTKNYKEIVYEVISKACSKLILEQEITNLPITSCVCSVISVLHYKFGNSFMIYFIKNIFGKFPDNFFTENNNDVNVPKSLLKNFTFAMIHFYIFQNITSKIYYEIIKYFIDNFNELFSEMLLILLSYIGIEIRKEDPESLKEIISDINKKYNFIKISSQKENVGKLKFIVDMIDDIRNNKYMKFNLSEKFNFFKTFINTNKKHFNIENVEKVDISIKYLQGLDKTKHLLMNDDIQSGGSSSLISGIDPNNSSEIYIPDDLLDDNTSKLLEKKMKRLKMTTDLKKTIFIAIVNSIDCNDAFERVMRLNLKKDQSREIIKTIVTLCNEEKCYNPFYKLLLDKLISVEKGHKYTFHYCIWDHMKIMVNYSTSAELKKIHNLSKLTADLLATEKISLPVLLNFGFEDANENQRIFVTFTLDYYFERIKGLADKSKLLFAKLVKNDQHVEFGRRLFNFLVNEFPKEVEINKKSNEYLDSYTASTKVLKRIL